MPDGTLQLRPVARDAIVAHARAVVPEEACGVLGGEDGGGDAEAAGGASGPVAAAGARVTTVERVANVADVPRTRYELDPEEQIAALEAIEGDGLDVVGFYHSHPRGPPEPSAVDRAVATWPGHVYLIVSLAAEEPSIGAWRWTGEQFRELAVAVS